MRMAPSEPDGRGSRAVEDQDGNGADTVVVERSQDPDDVRIAIGTNLNRRSGHELLQAAGAISAQGGSRLTVDLRNVSAFTEAGVAAATACRRLAAGLPRGVSFVASSASSRHALLAILDHT